jgi:hypothetical protein
MVRALFSKNSGRADTPFKLRCASDLRRLDTGNAGGGGDCDSAIDGMISRGYKVLRHSYCAALLSV